MWVSVLWLSGRVVGKVRWVSVMWLSGRGSSDAATAIAIMVDWVSSDAITPWLITALVESLHTTQISPSLLIASHITNTARIMYFHRGCRPCLLEAPW
jgi:hypothetical protein